jgi:hypothetical protein
LASIIKENEAETGGEMRSSFGTNSSVSICPPGRSVAWNRFINDIVRGVEVMEQIRHNHRVVAGTEFSRKRAARQTRDLNADSARVLSGHFQHAVKILRDNLALRGESRDSNTEQAVAGSHIEDFRRRARAHDHASNEFSGCGHHRLHRSCERDPLMNLLASQWLFQRSPVLANRFG